MCDSQKLNPGILIGNWSGVTQDSKSCLLCQICTGKTCLPVPLISLLLNPEKFHEIKPPLPSPCHVARTGDNLVVVDEATAGQISCVSRKLSRHTNIALACLQAVDGTNVVQATAGHIAARRCVGTGHHPARAKWNGVHLQGMTEVGTLTKLG